MNEARNTYRGQPLVALLLILGGWTGMRAIALDMAAKPPAEPAVVELPVSFPVQVAAQAPVAAEPDGPDVAVRVVRDAAVSLPPPMMPVPARPLGRPPVLFPPVPAAGISVPAPARPFEPPPVSVRASGGHNLLWMAAVSRLPILVAQAAEPPPDAVVVPPVSGAPVRVERRWSADGWLLLRDGRKSGLAGVSAPASYGGSQAGAVLRYRLAPQSRKRPTAYLRAAAALGELSDQEVAVGLSARPVAAIPVAVGGELRVRDEHGGTRVRPSVLAVTELPSREGPLGTRLEFYGQAGYVGGPGATPFADGQLQADRSIARVGQGELRAGGAIWGGAQKGAARLDIGPTASVGLPVSPNAGARVAVDWRFRVSGNAAPASGPALTLSAGF